jgi:hypothetical protein
MGNVSIGTVGISTHKLNVEGNINATSFSGSGSSLNSIPFTALSGTAPYLQLNGNNTMSGSLNITANTSPQIVLTNTTSSSYTSIRINNGFKDGHIGIGGSQITGTSYFNNNVFIQAANSFIIQTSNQNTTNIPRMIIDTAGNVGIATTNPTAKLHIEHLSTSTSIESGGIYVYNPTNAATNTATIGVSIAGALALRALFSLVVKSVYGWSIYIAGSDTANKYLRFNNYSTGLGTDVLRLGYDGSAIISGNIIADGSSLNNLKLEKQSNYTYPPSALNASTTITNSLYANGTYTITASTAASGKEPFKCFNLNTTDEWSPSTASYNGTLNAYGSSTYSTFVSDISYNGEWIQLQYNKGFAANSFTITGIAASNIKCPSNFILAGSVDAKNWILLSSQTGITNYTSIPSKTFSIYNYTSYNYYRIIVTKTIADTNLSIAEISFIGNQNTSFTNRDEYNIIPATIKITR